MQMGRNVKAYLGERLRVEYEDTDEPGRSLTLRPGKNVNLYSRPRH
jgi:hypothetical protein